MIEASVILTSLATSAVTAAGTLYAGAKGYFDKWLQSRFDRELEAFRSEKARELEAMKFEASRLLDRATKVNQHEFEVLPAVWDKMTWALSSTQSLISRGQIVPTTAGMSLPQMEALFEKLGFEKFEKVDLFKMDQAERDEAVVKKHRWQRLQRTEELHGEFQNYFIANSVFLSLRLRTEFRALSNLNYDAFMEYKIFLQMNYPAGSDFWTKRDKFLAEWEAGFERVLKMIQGQLWTVGDNGKDIIEQRNQLLADGIADTGAPSTLGT